MVTDRTSIGCRWLTRATKSRSRQSVTICATNYSGRASELGGTINLVDRRRSSLSHALRRRTHFFGGQFTPPDTTQTALSRRVWRAVWTGHYSSSCRRSIPRRVSTAATLRRRCRQPCWFTWLPPTARSVESPVRRKPSCWLQWIMTLHGVPGHCPPLLPPDQNLRDSRGSRRCASPAAARQLLLLRAGASWDRQTDGQTDTSPFQYACAVRVIIFAKLSTGSWVN